MITKNRNRTAPTFANINLLGKCNARCFFCLGKDLNGLIDDENQLNLHYTQWKNFPKFLSACAENGIKKLYITGQTADGLQYKYLTELVHYLQNFDFTVGIRTNGYLAHYPEKLRAIKEMDDEIGYSIHSLNPETNKLIMGREDIPDWDTIIPASGDNTRVAIVINRHNRHEILDLMTYISKFKNVRYIQLRRISTDNRFDEHEIDLQAFEDFYKQFISTHEVKATYESAEIYEHNGMPVSFWRTVETSANSFNYFTDGTVSDEYFVVEGYLKYRNQGVHSSPSMV